MPNQILNRTRATPCFYGDFQCYGARWLSPTFRAKAHRDGDPEMVVLEVDGERVKDTNET